MMFKVMVYFCALNGAPYTECDRYHHDRELTIPNQSFYSELDCLKQAMAFTAASALKPSENETVRYACVRKTSE